MARNELEIVAGIYEASFVPEMWGRVIDDVASLTDTYGGVLFVDGKHGLKWTATDNMRGIMQGFVDGGWNNGNTRTANRLRCRRAGFLNDLDLFSAEQLATEPMYVEHFRPLGLGWSASTAICATSEDVIVFDLEQRYGKGPVSRETLNKLDGLRPHISRASLTASRLGLRQAQSTVGAFDMIGLPAAVVTRTGRVVAANGAFETLREQTQILANDKLQFAHRPAQEFFAHGVEHGSRDAKAVLSFVLPATDEAPAAVAQIIPLHGVSCDVFGAGDAVLLVSPVANPNMPNADILAALFDLTPAEARVARSIVSGQTSEGVAATLGLSTHTVRSQVKSVFAKAGVKRKIDLANLVGRCRHGASRIKPQAHSPKIDDDDVVGSLAVEHRTKFCLSRAFLVI